MNVCYAKIITVKNLVFFEIRYTGTISIHNMPRLRSTNVTITNDRKLFQIKKKDKKMISYKNHY